MPASSLGRLLLVEDDPATRKALRSILQRRGWDVVLATTLAEGRAALEAGPHTMILDLMLPDGDGSTLLRAAREREDWVRVIVTTGSSDLQRLDELRALRPDFLFSKPIELQRLLEALESPPRATGGTRRGQGEGGLPESTLGS